MVLLFGGMLEYHYQHRIRDTNQPTRHRHAQRSQQHHAGNRRDIPSQYPTTGHHLLLDCNVPTTTSSSVVENCKLLVLQTEVPTNLGLLNFICRSVQHVVAAIGQCRSSSC